MSNIGVSAYRQKTNIGTALLKRGNIQSVCLHLKCWARVPSNAYESTSTVGSYRSRGRVTKAKNIHFLLKNYFSAICYTFPHFRTIFRYIVMRNFRLKAVGQGDNVNILIFSEEQEVTEKAL